MLRRIARIDGGKSGRDTDIRKNHAQIALWNDLADQRLYLGDLSFGDRDTRARGRFDVDHEHAGVRARKEGQAEEREQGQTCGEGSSAQSYREPGVPQSAAYHPVVDPQEPLKTVVEPDVETLA